MKKVLFSFFSLLAVSNAQAQLVISPNQTASYLANKLVATSGTLGVVVSNEVLTCDASSNGEFTGTSNLGISDGIALGTGSVLSNSGNFGLDGLPADMASTMLSTAGDAQLATIVGMNTFDACVLEFDLQPVGSFVEFEYVFGSEEYPMYNCSAFNDVFGFFISGPGFSSPTNIALIPGTSTPVSINSINDGSVTTCTPNTALYVNNTGTTCTMNGFTVPMTAHAAVTSGSTYHLKMAITDVSDGILNSYVILKANSLKSGGSIPNNVTELANEAGLEMYPTSFTNSMTIKNTKSDSWKISITDLNGRLVYTTQSEGASSISIHLETLSQGMYMLKAESMTTHNSFTQKLIKE